MIRSVIEAGWYNLWTKIVVVIVRALRLEPRCMCGWRLAQRGDGTWLCGRCCNVAFPSNDPLRGRRKSTRRPCGCLLCEKGRES